MRSVPVFLALFSAVVQGADLSTIKPLLERYCHACHGEATQQGGINLARLATKTPLVKNRHSWDKVIAALEMGRMPPKELPQPSDDERMQLLGTLDELINGFDYSQIDDPGFEPLKRLTHTEYDNTIRDLIGVDLGLARKFTSEMTGETGFDNSASTLFLQSTLMERYMAAAERLVEEAFERPEALETVFPFGFADTDAHRTLQRFLMRAYRRPVTKAEIARAMGAYQSRLNAGKSPRAAIESIVASTLISPKFLFRIESARPGGEAWPIDNWELASRLSYFLWASMPDDGLFEFAAANTLHEPDVFDRQVSRMLADEKADTLGTVFAAQWFGFNHVGKTVRMGAIDFPWCTDSLMDAMRAESSMFFMSLLRENAPIKRLVDADYTFVNQELAEKLYKMEGIEGVEMRRVSLDDPNRGGILTHPTTLAITSNYNKTSPVKRGHWVLEQLLGTPPPPPPPNAGVFDQDVSQQSDLTFREKLAMHSDNESCRSCHEMIDPLGFGLENFDYFGQWREQYTFRIRIKKAEDINVDNESEFKKVYKDIDVSGVLPEGASFSGPARLKKALIENRHDDLVRQATTKMLSYALGRPLEYYDEPAVRKIIASLEGKDFRFQTLLEGVVNSYPFRYKKAASEDSD